MKRLRMKYLHSNQAITVCKDYNSDLILINSILPRKTKVYFQVINHKKSSLGVIVTKLDSIQ